jgi:hypothetical protein
MSVSLLLGLVYLISELLLTVTRRSRTRFFASGASHSDTGKGMSQHCESRSDVLAGDGVQFLNCLMRQLKASASNVLSQVFH